MAPQHPSPEPGSSISVKPIHTLLRHHFLIPAYQRGYRWTPYQVEALLRDVAAFRSSDAAFYCLQPVVVRRRGSDEHAGPWELVDGQQRLTTIWLILQALGDGENAYRLEFATDARRTGAGSSQQLLADIARGGGEAIGGSSLEARYLKQAHKCVADWAAPKTDEEKAAFRHNLLQHTRIIWYETSAQGPAQEVFTRLNAGKIALTNAELIKALLLRRPDGGPAGAQFELASDWEWIERELQRPEFWGFLNGNPDEGTPRIERLFRLLWQPQQTGYYNLFDEVAGQLEKGQTPRELWQQVKNLFLRLQGWFEDHNLYHRVGYLLATGEHLRELLGKSAAGKTVFMKHVLQRIRVRGLFPDGEIDTEWTDLRYDEHSAALRNVLLLFNVATAWQASGAAMRFPFHHYRATNWSLEHIHPQQPQEIRENGKRRQWIDDVQRLVADLPATDETRAVLAAITAIYPRLDDDADDVTEAFGQVQAQAHGLFSDLTATRADGHALDNLALLATRHNASLGNSTFPQKRERLLQLAQDPGAFVPPATLYVFLKRYSPAAASLHFWHQADRDAYLSAIRATIQRFVPKP